MECGAVYLFGLALYFPGNRKKAVLRFNRTLGKAGESKCLWRRYASKCEKLHLGLGFSCLGVYRRTGFKCGSGTTQLGLEKKSVLIRRSLHP